ncbi:hypothetical protein A7U60_g1158 [Sanghuangporus baumii]|uniref:Uncharacterized protein n=1 Tax=Sanghuangporus baumii TaxID=108892 RepID=A0A9Q5I4K0_SANBA|nr:hypothetical protein A7U60_g1158 [Sanghuangporus baumii]
MRLLAVYALFLSYSFGSLDTTLDLRAVQSDGLASCPSAVEVNSTIINANGNEIQSRTFICLDDSLSTHAATTSQPRKSFNSPSELLRRSAAECKTPAPECQCGLQFGCSCSQLTPSAPEGGDCRTLIDALQVISQAGGPTFTVPSSGVLLLEFQTCAIEWINLRNAPLEYCWDELGTLVSLTDEECLIPAVSTGAACTPADGLWVLQVFRVGT